MKLPKLNVRLLKRVLHHIEVEPLRFDMRDYAYDSDDAPCDTQACLAGWAYILDKGNTKKVRERAKYINANTCSTIHSVARRVLGLTYEEAQSLFLTEAHTFGKRGVEIAKKKIELLLKDREKFVEKYPY